MGKDFEIEEGKEVVRRTIVGGRPLARKRRKLKIPIGIEKVLCRAAVEPKFKAELLENRAGALARMGDELTEAERGIIKSIPVESLETMISGIDPKRHAGRRFMKGVMAAAVVTAALTTNVDCSPATTGVGADDDWEEPEEIRAEEVFAPETAVKGIQPDDVLGVSDNVAPDIVETQDGQAILGIDPEVVEPDVIQHEDLMAPGGIIPDSE